MMPRINNVDILL